MCQQLLCHQPPGLLLLCAKIGQLDPCGWSSVLNVCPLSGCIKNGSTGVIPVNPEAVSITWWSYFKMTVVLVPLSKVISIRSSHCPWLVKQWTALSPNQVIINFTKSIFIFRPPPVEICWRLEILPLNNQPSSSSRFSVTVYIHVEHLIPQKLVIMYTPETFELNRLLL